MAKEKIDTRKVIVQVSRDVGVDVREAEKALDSYYRAISKEIASGNYNSVDMKHLGKFTPKIKRVDGTGVSYIGRRPTDIQPVCKDD
jgi:nucleoid DNA-binding protein